MRLYSWLDLFASRLRRVWRRPQGRAGRSLRSRKPSLSFERLEDRVLLSAPNPVHLADLNGGVGQLNGTDGFTINGAALSTSLGWSVADAGDINGDGFSDIIIGAPYADAPDPANVGQYFAGAGRVFVVYGKADATATHPLDLTTLDGTNGFVINGFTAGSHLGFSVAGVGDMNGDDRADIAVMASDSNTGQGRGWVLFRSAQEALTGNGVVNIANLNGGADDSFGARGFRIEGFSNGANSGYSISKIGDLDGDGFDDIVVGTPFLDDNGTAAGSFHGHSTIIFGDLVGVNNSGGWFDHALVVLNNPGGDGHTFRTTNMAPGAESGDELGFAVAGIGDINGDGKADLAVAAPGGNNNDQYSGKVYVIFGAERGSLPANTGALNGTNGFRLEGIEISDYAGWSLSRVGDVNGDGFDDFIIGAPYADPQGDTSAGESYVIFGKPTFANLPGGAGIFDLSTLDGSNGFKIVGEKPGDLAGWSVGGGGDIDGDGFDDIIVGAPGFYEGVDPGDFYSTGRTYVVFGKKTGFDPTFLLKNIDGVTGFAIDGIGKFDRAGQAVSSAGDVNGDGFDDILIGAPNAYSAVSLGYTGQVHVVFGGNYRPLPGTQVGTTGDDTLDGATTPNTRDVLVGGLGSDHLISDGGPDVLRGGGGALGANRDDFLEMSDTQFYIPTSGATGNAFSTRRLVGGLGQDTLIFNANGATLDLTAITDNRIKGIENIDIRGTGDNTLVVTKRDIINLSDTSNTVVVRRGIGDSYVIADSGWVQRYDTVDTNPLSSTYGVTFEVFVNGRFDSQTGQFYGARLLVEDPSVLNYLQLDGYDPSTGGTSGVQPAGHQGVTILGAASYDFAGVSVSGVGDVNGDGFDDFLVGAYGSDPNGSRSGAAFLIFGKGTTWDPTFDLADTLSHVDGVHGVELAGIDPGDLAGWSVRGLGDVNGDGLSDFMIGAYRADRGSNPNTSEGEAYVVFGKANWSSTPVFQLSSLNGSNGFVLRGNNPDDFAGFSVSTAGDINGDGFADMLVSAYRADPGAAYAGQNTVEGSVYVVFGGATKLASLDALDGVTDGKIDLHRVDGVNGFRIDGINPYDLAGRSVSSAGDFNGDGFGDIIVGARGADSTANLSDNQGGAFVLFGKSNWTGTPVFKLSTIDGSNGVRFNGINPGDWAGFAVSGAGDVNGDGFDDVIIGAYRADPNGTDSGESYVVFGKASWSAVGTAGFDLASINGTNGIRVIGGGIIQSAITGSTDYAGWAVTSVGDFNGDGFDDLVIGARRANAHTILLATTTTGGQNSTGQGYLVFGKADWSATPDFLPEQINGLNGIRLDGIAAFDYSTRSVRYAGDVNGDGFDDFLIGAHKADTYSSYPFRNSNGAAYLVFGGSYLGTSKPVIGTSGSNNLNANGGAAVGDYIVAGQGNDTLTSDGGPDAFHGGQGNYIFRLTNVDFTGTRKILGGNGTDTLVLYNLFGVTLDLTGIHDNRIQDIEVIDITGIGNNALKLNQREVLNLSSTSNTLTVLRDRGDVITDSGVSLEQAGWVHAGTAEWDNVRHAFFDIYTMGAAKIKLQSEVVVITGSTADVQGTSLNDIFTYNATTSLLTVNGTMYDLTLAGGITYVALDGKAGTDQFIGTGTAGADLLNLSNTGVQFEFNSGHAGFDLVGASIELAGLDGLGGIDTFKLTGANQTLNLTTTPGSLTRNVEFIDITGAGNNTLNINLNSVLNNAVNPMTVLRNNGDVVNVLGAWTHSTNAYFDGTTYYDIYNSGPQVLRVQSAAVVLSGSNALVSGTDGNDTFVFDAVTSTISVNGTNYVLPGTATYISLDGKAGNDQLSLLGTAAADRVVLSPTAVNFEFNAGHAGFDFGGANIEKFIVDGRGGADQATMFDSAGDNLFTTNGTTATMTGDTTNYLVVNFEQIVGSSTHGGLDRVEMNDTAGDDVFSASPTVANMSGAGYFDQAVGFKNVTGKSHLGGTDTAFLQDSAGDDVFNASVATGIATLAGTGFFNTALNFATVSAQAIYPNGGNDTAFILDSSGNDTFVSRRDLSFLKSASGVFMQAEKFEIISGRSTAGGFDQAFLYDNPGDDLFTGTQATSNIAPKVNNGGIGNYREATGFDVVAGRSTSGGSDKAMLFDTAGKDVLSMTATIANFSNPNGLYLQAEGFQYVAGRSNQGGGDFAFLAGSAGNDTYVAQFNLGTLKGPGTTPQYILEAGGFRTISARGEGGIDIATLYDSVGNDTFTANGTTGVATLQGTTFYNETVGFKQVMAVASQGTDIANLTDSPGNDLFFARLTDGYMQGTGYHNAVSHFDTVSIYGITGGTNTLDAKLLQFNLNVVSNWTPV